MRILHAYGESGHPLVPGTTILKQGTLTQKWPEDSITFQREHEVFSTISKLVESANILCMLFEIKVYLEHLQQGNLLIEQKAKEEKELFLDRKNGSAGYLQEF